ncbi:GNAT family N-acetyltransferase [Psychroflexus aestuariivivens]|uniref:GNAT family N-acetyltransferase n=1 Tax=Psychroflexus aestuariivivens TaxID=1795040 RepID=UPI000FD94DFB|nr:GNAT family protein [Psychroflexus aestuariivivens]
MLTLKSEHILLRALESDDLDFLELVENDEKFWHLSDTIQPFSREVLAAYLANSHRDIFEMKQMRMVIALHNKQPIGFIDLYDFDPKNKRAGLGVLIVEDFQSKGYGKQALDLMINYCFTVLDLHQIYASITENNEKSLKLFKQFDFEIIGLKKDWTFTQGQFNNEYLLQRIKNVH